MIRVLHVVSIMNAGGMENYIMNLYRNIDTTKIQFDFLVHHKAKGLYEDEILKYGGKIFHMSVLDDKNMFKYWHNLKEFFREHQEYKIIHGHLSSMAYWYLGAAKKRGVKWRIAHSHGAGFLHTWKGITKFFLFRLAKINANVYYACSAEAGKYLFGKRKFEFMPNAIQPDRFRFDSKVREEMRSKLMVSDNFVIGHVGRFNLEKNHKYLLQVFQALYLKEPRARLLLVGDGELRETIIRQIQELDLEDAVILTGVQKECEKFYQAMDVFVLPSLFEGLPVTGIEAQYAGLNCAFSDEVSRKIKISNHTKFIGIKEKNIPDWIEYLLEICNDTKTNRKNIELVTDEFDIKKAVINITEQYVKMWEDS